MIIFIGTHDIQNISVSSPQPGEIRVTGYFIQGSTASGVLVAILTRSEIYFHLLSRIRGQPHLEGTISNVVGGQHNVSVFVVEENGLPFSRTASVPEVVFIKNSKQYLNGE